MPFIASADGILSEKDGSISLLGRGMALAAFLPIVKDRQIIKFNYSETLYLISTDGKTFSK